MQHGHRCFNSFYKFYNIVVLGIVTSEQNNRVKKITEQNNLKKWNQDKKQWLKDIKKNLVWFDFNFESLKSTKSNLHWVEKIKFRCLTWK
jgi:hypothetical protein